MQQVSGTETYVAGSGNRAVVIFHDIFGLHTGRHKQIAGETLPAWSLGSES